MFEFNEICIYMIYNMYVCIINILSCDCPFPVITYRHVQCLYHCDSMHRSLMFFYGKDHGNMRPDLPGKVLHMIILEENFTLANSPALHLEAYQKQSTVVFGNVHFLIEVKCQKFIPATSYYVQSLKVCAALVPSNVWGNIANFFFSWYLERKMRFDDGRTNIFKNSVIKDTEFLKLSVWSSSLLYAKVHRKNLLRGGFCWHQAVCTALLGKVRSTCRDLLWQTDKHIREDVFWISVTIKLHKRNKNQTLETTMTHCWTQEFHSHKSTCSAKQDLALRKLENI